MYRPKHFVPQDRERVLDLIREFPFATLITKADDGSLTLVDHVPLILSEGVLVGHFARANPHVAALRAAGETLAVFHGPHAYVSPRWYREYDVPTWNYAVVHVTGKVRLITDEAGLRGVLGLLVRTFEGATPAGPLVPEDLAAAGVLERAIVGFEIELGTLEAKMKLSQNREPEDRERVAAQLEMSADSTERAVAGLMRRFSSEPQ